MSEKLYTLADRFIAVKDYLESQELDPQTLLDTLESVQLPIQDKAENTIKYIKHLEYLAKAQKEEAKLLTERAKQTEAKAESLMIYLDMQMKKLEKKELQAGVFTLSYKKGSQITEVDIQELPASYWIPQDPKPMGKDELAKRIKEGEEIPGVRFVRNPDKLVIK